MKEKIVLITPEIGRDKGGIQNWMHYLALLLSLEKYKTFVYAYKEDNFFSSFLPIFKNRIFFLATWKMSFFIGLGLINSRNKIFVFVLGNEILNLNYFQKKWLMLLSHRSNTYFISVSKASAEIFYHEIGRKVDIVQYPFMEIADSTPKKREVKCLRFLTITRLVKRKNIHKTILALHKLKEDGLDFTYTIAGSGNEQKNLEKLVKKLSMQDEIKILGAVGEEEKNELYSTSDYFLLPSIFDQKNGSIEGYGIVYIEANSYALPVLSGNTGGMIEAVKDNITGYQCDGTVGDIAQKIKKMLNTQFNSSALYAHAQEHDYLKQKQFLHFIEKSLHG
jgi:glycosyltransferase involved in cell wall biosynthesis